MARRLIIASVLAASLVGCTPSWPAADWSSSPQISKTAVLRFVAPADCGTPWPFNPVNGEFYPVTSARRISGQGPLYQIEYRTPEPKSALFYVVQRWTAAETHTSSAPVYDQGLNCAVLVDVPQAANDPRPYFVPGVEEKSSEYRTGVTVENLVLWPLVVLFSVVSVFAFFGLEQTAPRWVPALTGVGAVITMVIGAAACIDMPWQAFGSAREYWEWFDALPRVNGELLPMTADTFDHLLKGPPNNTGSHAGAWAVVTLLASGAWLALFFGDALTGWYYLTTPLPLQQIYRRALAQGRAPTVEELDDALRDAIVGKEAWEIELMCLKTKRFIRRFGPLVPRVLR